MRINNSNKARLVGYTRTDKPIHTTEAVDSERKVLAISRKSSQRDADQKVEYVYGDESVSANFELELIEEAEVIEEIEYSNLSHQLFHQYKSGVDRLEGLHTSRYFSADIEQTTSTKNPATKHQRYFDQMIKFANPKGDWLDARA